MQNLHLYMLLLGCKPDGRHTEQHDVLFTAGTSLKELIPDMENFWPEAKGKIHIDAWRKISRVNGFDISVKEKNETISVQTNKLFFINLGGYRSNEFEEFHYKILSVNTDKSDAIKQAKQNLFYKENIASHIDDKYGVDVDDIYNIEDILPAHVKEKYYLEIVAGKELAKDDELNIGYTKLSSL